ncbi:MAG: hypothetical protein V1799_21825 [bacterium]
MIDPYSLVMLIKHYAWQARDQDKKPILATRLLRIAYEIAQDDLTDYLDLQRQLKRDIAELNLTYGKKDTAISDLVVVGDGFKVGDLYLQEGRFEEALRIYQDFHNTGRFKDYWRLWKCSFLLGKYRDSLKYFEQETVAVIPDYRIHALAIAAVQEYFTIIDQRNWNSFQNEFPKTAAILTARLGNASIIEQTAKRWISSTNLEKIRTRLLGKTTKALPDTYNDNEFNNILEKAYLGIGPKYADPAPTATSVLKSLVQEKRKLDGQIVVEHLSKGLINRLIIDFHKKDFCRLIDSKLLEFELTNHSDFISFYGKTILGNFGFYEQNEVSQAIKMILLEAEKWIRLENNLPLRGEGWLSEAEMVRLLRLKFHPHEVLTQYSPKWLQHLRFDAFVSDFNLAIEYQGEQHFHPIDIFGGIEGHSEIVARDEFKRNLAKENGVVIEYITFEQDIDQETTRLYHKYLNICSG